MLSILTIVGLTACQGEIGSQGPGGDKGEQGPQGPAGEDGLSSYEIYIKYNWYRGTEEDWINDLASGVLANRPSQYPVNLAEDGLSFTYGKYGEEKTVSISDKAIYLDGSLSDEEISTFSNVYNDFNEAIKACKDGTEEDPMVLYIAPWTYWIHDPYSKETNDPFGLYVDCDNLHMVGLTENPENVVIAGNFGHNEGFVNIGSGTNNWTMFNFTGDGLNLSNIRFGGYCNIDLDYKLNPKLNVPMRTDNVTQCQIATLNGDKFYAQNCDFISRLNMMPFNNRERALYVDCHFESTADSLNGSSKAVYLNCDFDFYSSKPWGGSSGATVLNSDMYIVPKDTTPGQPIYQELCKCSADINLIDVRFHHNYDVPVYVGYNDVLGSTYRAVYSNVTLNDEAIKMDRGGLDLNASVDITNTDALKAFKLIDADNKVIYNVYNLLRGDDNWDPLAQEEQIKALNVADMPLSLTAYVDSEVGKPQSVTLETGKDTATLLFDINGLYGSNYKDGITATWSVLDEELTDLVKLEPTTNGESCVVTPLNELYHPVVIIVEVKTNTGFVGAVELTINPEIRQAPEFTKAPEIVLNGDGTATLDYELNVGEFKETSTIKWYLADDNASTNKILIQDDHKTIIGKDVKLTKAYVDKYLVAEITPSHIISEVGETVEIISKTRITAQGIVDSNEVVLTPSLFPTAAQIAIIPGFFTVDTYAPSLEAVEDANGEWNIKGTPGSNNSWGYGVGPKDGYLNYAGLYQNGFGARLVYTPLNQSVGDMSVEVKGAPGKTAGQGFGSDRNYMDLFIKYDLATKTGYAVRIYRVSGSSCGVVLIEFNNGIPTMLTGKEEHITSGYLTEFTLKAWIETIEGKTTLHASLETTAQEPTDNQLEHSVSVSAEIEENGYGAFGLHYVSSAGAAGNSTYIGSMKATYNGSFQNEVATSV